jgi:DNA-binding LytR/AlgR family response regulator
MIIRCAIIDDEFLARQYLKDYVSKVPFLQLTGDYSSPLLALEDLKNNNIDLLFLDIQMPDISGIEFLKTLNPQPFIIFTTAYKKYALEGYEHNTIDYLLKPISFERFLKSVNKINDIIQIGKGDTVTMPDDKSSGDYITIRADRKFYKINYDDIFYIEGQQAYVTFNTRDKKITGLMSMKDLEENLPGEKFIRIHKSFIVSKKYIISLEGNQVDIHGHKLPVGKSYRENVQRLFNMK